MANLENFYLLLGFSIEKFISDQQTCLAALDQKQKEWNASNNTQIRSKVDTYYKSGIVKEAISNPNKWKSIYQEAKEEVDGQINDYISIFAGKGYITEEEIAKVPNKKDRNVSVEYVRELARIQGIPIQDGVKPDKNDDKRPMKSLADYAPANEIKFKQPTKQLQVIGCADYYDFLNRYGQPLGVSGGFSMEADPKKCVSAAETILSGWDAKKATPEKAAVEQLCNAIKFFDNPDHETNQKNYNQYLIWQGMKSILDQLWGIISKTDVKVINEVNKSNIINKLVEIISDRKAAEEILTSFCNEKGIEMPKKPVNYGVCLFCGHSFERKGSALKQCPSCNRSFEMKCPVCSSTVNCMEQAQHCGFNFDQYPRVKKMCDETMNLIDELNFDFAEQRLADINSIWKNFPDAIPVKQVLESKKKIAGAMISRLKDLVRQKKMKAALLEYKNIKTKNTGYSDSVMESIINNSIAEADELNRQLASTSDNNQKLRLLIQIGNLVSDYPGLNQLDTIPPTDILSVKAVSDQNLKSVNVVWDSQNLEGTVDYMVLRKIGAPLASATDGEEIARTQDRSFSDKRAEEGCVYYYAVYAVRGSNKTRVINVTEPAVIFPKITSHKIMPGENRVQAQWTASSDKMKTEVFRCDNPSQKRYGEGVPVYDVSGSELIDSGLQVGRRYSYNLFFTCNAGGKKLRFRSYSF